MIELKKLSKTYHLKSGSFNALTDIDLSIQRKEIFGILGKSGAGKSTLLRCINFLERPSSGSVIINNINLSTLTPGELRGLRHKVGMIFQGFNLLASRTAFGNIALALELIGESQTTINHKVNKLLDLVDLKDRANHYPHELSGGQKQRVAIARALATDPDILLCDEATSALDPDSTKNILQLLQDINQNLGLTIVLITHELEVVKQICDRTAVLEQGRLIELADTLEIFANPQHATTKQLVDKALHFEIPAEVLEHKDNATKALKLLRFTFVGDDSESPLITDLIRHYDVVVNIQQADITKIKNKTVGYTICEISGAPDAVRQALSHVDNSGVRVEVIDHA